MNTQLLREPEIVPTDEVLKNVLGNIYPVLETLRGKITDNDLGLTLEWNYYKDGKSWLCKVCHKKKTVFWLSIWDEYFQAGFFFMEKHLEGIAALNINEKVQEEFMTVKPIGKLLPMIFRISNESQLADLLKVVEFKKKQK